MHQRGRGGTDTAKETDLPRAEGAAAGDEHQMRETQPNLTNPQERPRHEKGGIQHAEGREARENASIGERHQRTCIQGF